MSQAQARAKDGTKAKVTAQEGIAAGATAPTIGPGQKSRLEMKPHMGLKFVTEVATRPSQSCTVSLLLK